MCHHEHHVTLLVCVDTSSRGGMIEDADVEAAINGRGAGRGAGAGAQQGKRNWKRERKNEK